jgi:K+-transporting ATPase c subunit
MTSTTTKSLSQLDQEFSNTLMEYNIAKVAKERGNNVDNLLKVLKLALDRINAEMTIAMEKNDEEFPYDPDEDDREDLASQRYDW